MKPSKAEEIRSEINRIKLIQPNQDNQTVLEKRLQNGFKLNNRVKIDTGKFCNARCNFCYYIDRVKDRDQLTIEEVQDYAFIEKLLANGVREFEFSGGEPTTCWDMLPITEYIVYIAKEMFNVPKNEIHISVVTNGYLLRDRYLYEKIKENHVTSIYGPQFKHVEEILFSLHGWYNNHDKITGIKNSFTKIIDFIDEWLYEKDNPTETTYLLQYVSKIRINVVVQENTFVGEDGLKFAQLLIGYMSRGIQINLLPHNTWDASDISLERSQVFFDKIQKNINNFIDLLDAMFTMFEQNNKRYHKLFGANLFNIRYHSPCQITLDKYRKYVVSHFDHLFDQSDWNKYYYPQEAYIKNIDKNIKNVYPSEKINHDLLIQKYLEDANQSHYVDKTCSKCLDFKNLKCDGQKYTNQKTKEINYNINELRRQYVGSKINSGEYE